MTSIASITQQNVILQQKLLQQQQLQQEQLRQTEASRATASAQAAGTTTASATSATANAAPSVDTSSTPQVSGAVSAALTDIATSGTAATPPAYGGHKGDHAMKSYGDMSSTSDAADTTDTVQA